MFRDLRADEIDLRIGTITKKGYSLLLYKDARCDMNILDEEIGSDKWQRDHKEVKGNLYCGVSILTDNGWVTKWDCGTESYTEKEKGEASDSFKRACFNWGIGRELYTAPLIWISASIEEVQGRLKLSKEDEKIYNNLIVKEFECENKVIKKLVIVDKRNDMVAFAYGVKEKPIQNNIVGGEYVLKNGKYKGYTIQQVFEIDREYFDYCLKNVTNFEMKQNFKKCLLDNGFLISEEV